MQAQNPKYNAFGTIDLEINHPVYGWIPFTASPDDMTGAAIYEAAMAGDFGPIGEYVAPPPAHAQVPRSVTRRQARQALLLSGKLAQVQPAIDSIPDPIQRGMVQIEWDDSQTFERNRPALIALATAIGLDSAQIDNLFIEASKL
jgi:hypothetical protein